MPLIQISEPANEPISLADARLHLRADPSDTSEDATIGALITTVRKMAEHELGRSLITQTWELVLDAFPCDEIRLARPKVQSITSIKYIDTSQVEQTVSALDYTLDASTLPGWVKPAYDAEWPSDVLDSTNVVRVRFVTGYGDNATDVPAPIVAWMKIHLATLWKNRTAIVQGVSVAPLPDRYVERLLDGERWYG